MVSSVNRIDHLIYSVTKKALAFVQELRERKKATTGFEPVIKVLQTSALPLGHVAKNERQAQCLPLH